jgi:cobalt-zinc-cadmium efflux system membrane fusion protein
MSDPKRRNTGLMLLFAGVLLGAAGTVVMMSRVRPAVSAIASAEEHGHEGKAGHAQGEEHGPIRLSAEAARVAGIRVETVRLVPMGEILTVPGTVEVSPGREAKITPPAPGKIVRLLAKPGDTVRAGQPLAILDSFEVAEAHAKVREAGSGVQQAQAALQTARAEVEQARASVKLAEADAAQARARQQSAETALGRQKDLAAAGAFSQAPLQTAQSELAEAQSALLKAQTDLHAHAVALQRAERLFKEELISRSELEQAQAEHRKDQAEIERAQARVNQAKQTLDREQKVFRGDLLTRQAVQTAEADVRAAQGDVQKALQGVARARQDVRRAQKGEQAARTALRGAQAALDAARSTLSALAGTGHRGSLLTLYAPLGGTVTERHATPGEAVERTAVLFVVENLNTVMVRADVPEKDVARVRVGLSVEVSVSAYPRERFSGVAQSLGGRVDEKTRALPVRCLVENRGGRLRPEMFARVRLAVGARTNAPAVPLSALDEHGEERHVFVEENGGFERRKVHVGRRTETMVEILSGLRPGERVAVEGVFVLESESKKEELKGHED